MSERYAAARDIHTMLYTALANGDQRTVEEIACSGLFQQLKIRLEQRKAAKMSPESWHCEYKGYSLSSTYPWLLQFLLPNKSTTIVSDKLAEVDQSRGFKIRQVVAKLRTQQTLDQHDGVSRKDQQLDEYLVFQKMIFEGKEEKWMVWGTTMPMNEQQLDEFFTASARQESFWDKLKSMFGSFAGGAGGTMA